MLKSKRLCFLFFLTLITAKVHAAEIPAGWHYEQSIVSPTTGFQKIKLPLEALNESNLNFSDVRVFDASGQEASILIQERTTRSAATLAQVKYGVSMIGKKTVIQIISSTDDPISGITIVTPSSKLLKAATVESAGPTKRWTVATSNQPIYRENGSDQLTVSFSPISAQYLRVTLNDLDSAAIPISNVWLKVAERQAVELDVVPVTIVETVNGDKESKIVLRLPAKNLYVANLIVNVDDNLFSRPVSLGLREINSNQMYEQNIRNGQLTTDSKSTRPNSGRFVINQRIGGTELILTLQNGDSPALQITSITAEVGPAFLYFNKKVAEDYHLAYGNKAASYPSYDTSGMKELIDKNAFSTASLSPKKENPGYVPNNETTIFPETAGDIDVSNWKYNKAIKISAPGIQQLELDLDVLSNMSPTKQDLRLVKNGKQIPYILDSFTPEIILSPTVTPIKNEKATESEWKIQLPRKNLSLDSLSCDTDAPLFERKVTLYQEYEDVRGEKHRQLYLQTVWRRSPQMKAMPLTLAAFNNYYPTMADTFILVVENGDNAPLVLSNFKLKTHTMRLLFKATSSDPVALYYGNDKAQLPRYDISLVAHEFLRADRNSATLEAEVPLQAAMWWKLPAPTGTLRFIFWAVLGIVVAILLVIIAKLLPEDPEHAKESL